MYYEILTLQSNIHKAIANTKRLEIIRLLRDEELTVSQMVDMLGLPQANLSQHLQVLREYQLVKTRRSGKEIYYRLAHPNLIVSIDLLREMLVDQHEGEDKLIEELRLKMKDLVPVTSDPVCGMRVSPKTAGHATKYQGQQVYFCAEGCLKKFKQSPKKFSK
jgi:ArsR family transcriptional regulator